MSKSWRDKNQWHDRPTENNEKNLRKYRKEKRQVQTSNDDFDVMNTIIPEEWEN